MGLLLNEKFDRDLEEVMILAEKELREKREKAAQEAKELAAKQEADRIERDARIAQEAAAKAVKESLDKAEREAELVRVDRFNSDHEIALLTNNKMAADAEKIASDARVKAKEEQDEKNRVEAAEKAKSDAKDAAENARLAEVRRQEGEAARIKADDEKREANKRHVGAIRRAAKESIIECSGCDEETAKKIVMAIHGGTITNITIKY